MDPSSGILWRWSAEERPHHYILGLPDAVCAVDALVVERWVPGRVQDDDPVGGSQGQAKPTHLGGQQEDWDVLLSLKPLDQRLQQKTELMGDPS